MEYKGIQIETADLGNQTGESLEDRTWRLNVGFSGAAVLLEFETVNGAFAQIDFRIPLDIASALASDIALTAAELRRSDEDDDWRPDRRANELEYRETLRDLLARPYDLLRRVEGADE